MKLVKDFFVQEDDPDFAEKIDKIQVAALKLTDNLFKILTNKLIESDDPVLQEFIDFNNSHGPCDIHAETVFDSQHERVLGARVGLKVHDPVEFLDDLENYN